jgi:hypothetical protein
MTPRGRGRGGCDVALIAAAGALATLLACSHGGSVATTGSDAAAAGAGGTGTGDPDGERTDAAGTGGSAGAGAGGAAACVAPPAPSAGASVHTGDLTISDAAGLEAARALSEVTGTLRVAPALSGRLDLPNLRVIGGDLIVEAVSGSPGTLVFPLISDLRLVNLTRIGGDLWLYLATSLVEADLPSLASVGGEVYVHRNVLLRDVGLDSLRDVGISVHFSANQLARCEVDAIVAALRTGTYSGLGGDRDCVCETMCGHIVPRCP